ERLGALHSSGALEGIPLTWHVGGIVVLATHANPELHVAEVAGIEGLAAVPVQVFDAEREAQHAALRSSGGPQRVRARGQPSNREPLVWSELSEAVCQLRAARVAE